MVTGKASQNFVPIKEIRDGIVVLKDGTLRSIILTTSVNLALKSEDEHNALIVQFQNFLNSLDFSIQILTQSRELDIRPYIISLESTEAAQRNPLLQIQTREYINFIKWFSGQINIMTKNFYIIVPYSGGDTATKSKTAGIAALFDFGKKETSKEELFEEKRSQLEQRVSVVQQGVSAMGIKGTVLKTPDLIEIYYNIFNPGEPQKGMTFDGTN